MVKDRVLDSVTGLFNRPLMQNNLRALYVEMLVLELIGDDWVHSGADWAAFDLQHRDGTKLEVKQSAARQSWEPSSRGYSPPRFGIRPAKRVWEGSLLTDLKGRQADIYVFAWHPGTDEDADHRSPGQWEFYAVLSSSLPDQDSIGLLPIRRIAAVVAASGLRETIDLLRDNRSLQ